MGLTDALFTGLSGLNVNTTEMNVVGNNIANANTTAFKSSRALFTPQFYVTDSAGTPPSTNTGGTDPSQHGLGASVASINENFTPGAIQSTGVNTDLAIDGSGFFVTKSAGQTQYTRNGAFTLNSNDQLVSRTGAFVQGFAADSNGNIIPGQLQDISIPLGTSSIASATTTMNFGGNLDASGIVAAGSSILLSQSLTTVGGAAAPSAATLLTNIASSSSSATPLFAAGDTLTLGATKGGRTLPTQSFKVTATTTVGDLQTFYQNALGIDPTTSANPVIPTPGISLQADPANANGAFLNVTGNEGTLNSLQINSASFTNQNGLSPLTFSAGTNAAGIASNPSGESVHTVVTGYDSLGNAVNVDVTAVLENTSTTGNTWRYFASSPDNAKSPGAPVGTGTLTFDSQGNLKASTGTSLTIDRTGTGAGTPLSVNLNFSALTELASQNSNLVLSSQDGLPPGSLSTFSIGTDGTITGSYTNGVKRSLGQVAFASFANPDGLNDLGGGNYTEGANSGIAAISSPEQLGTGALRSGSLELSNVDLSQEFTNLIIASTGFSASSKVISTSQQLIQDLLNSQH